MIERLRTWWQRLCDRLIVRDPYDVDSAFEDSAPRGSISEFMDSSPPTVPADDDPTVPGGLDTKPAELPL